MGGGVGVCVGSMEGEEKGWEVGAGVGVGGRRIRKRFIMLHAPRKG